MTFRFLMTIVDIPTGWILVPSDVESSSIPINDKTTDVVFIRFRQGNLINSNGNRGKLRYPGHWFAIHVRLKTAGWIVTCYDSLRGGDWVRESQACADILKTLTIKGVKAVNIVQGVRIPSNRVRFSELIKMYRNVQSNLMDPAVDLSRGRW